MMSCFEPYQSCSLFGAMRYFSNLKNTVSLINGPAGCTFYANNAIVRLNGYFNAPHRVEIPKIYCVDFNEKDAIMGSEKKLMRAAEELIDKYHPEILLVFNCCVSEIIGSDIDDVAESISAKYPNTLVIPFHTAGFKGDHKYGMKMASELMMKYIFCDEKSAEKDEKTVNILGEFDYFNRSTTELCMVLKQIGIEKINYVPGKCTLEELRESKNAALNIISCQNASRYLAMRMEKELDIPWMGQANSLYGVDNSYNFYKQICLFFHKDHGMLDEIRERALVKIDKCRKQLNGRRAVIVASTRRALGYSAILQELGVEIELLFSEGDDIHVKKDDFLQYSQNVLFNEYANELSERIEQLDVDFVFTTLPEIVAPVKYIQRPEIDYAGMEGATRMAEYLCDLLQSESKKVVIND